VGIGGRVGVGTGSTGVGVGVGVAPGGIAKVGRGVVPEGLAAGFAPGTRVGVGDAAGALPSSLDTPRSRLMSSMISEEIGGSRRATSSAE
jgi:hypothetical protein